MDYSGLTETPSLNIDTTDSQASRQLETARRAEGRAAEAQADVIREDRAVAGFEVTAQWFNYAGGLLALASAGLFLASFFVPPTIIPRRVALYAMLVSVGMLTASYFLVRYGVATAWILLAVFAVHAIVTAWPWIEGRLRASLERKGLAKLASPDVSTRVEGFVQARVANPVLKRKGEMSSMGVSASYEKPEASDG